MSERELIPAWAMRRWHRRLERHGSERVVRWIAFPDAKAKSTSRPDAPDRSSNDNLEVMAQREAI